MQKCRLFCIRTFGEHTHKELTCVACYKIMHNQQVSAKKQLQMHQLSKEKKIFCPLLCSSTPSLTLEKCRSSRMSRWGDKETKKEEQEKEQTLVISSILMILNVTDVSMTLKFITPPLNPLLNSRLVTDHLTSYWPSPVEYLIDVSKFPCPKLNTWSSPTNSPTCNSFHCSRWQLHPSNSSDQNLGVFLESLYPHIAYDENDDDDDVRKSCGIYV